MVLNCILWWYSFFGDLGSVEYMIIDITLKSSLTLRDSTRWDLIYGFSRTTWKLFVLDKNNWYITVSKTKQNKTKQT